MSLFQTSVVKKYLNELNPELIDKKYTEFQTYFGNPEIQQNIRESKEEEYQSGFVTALFVNILGYTLKPDPNYNFVLEKKNVDDSKKADGAILKDNDVIAVIELKSTQTTDLDTVETQAFGYKNHHPKCQYIITSNFEKIRIYIQNAVDHIEFDLFNLSRENFALLWLCFLKDNILQDIPLKIKEASVLQEENVTKKLYNDYSKFRQEIFNNIVKNNPEYNKLVLFKKTQKLLDRFLFIFFAEDRLLLPPNSISEIVKQWITLKDDLDAYVPLYERFKKYFGYLNKGFKGKKYDIFPYNGGLFAPDEILDHIKIDDEILHKYTVQLSTYDFETEVDVNILGHIFEHSLGEIESIQASLNGGVHPSDSKITKRKKDGIFYTPKYITKYIVENTVGKLCEEKRAELEIIDEEYAKGRKNRKKNIVRALDDKLTQYRDWLLDITILDPACGSGAFLNQALEFLIQEHKKIDELKFQLLGGSIVFPDVEDKILEKNIYGVDLNEESVEIAKLSLWLRTAQKGRKLTTLSNHIKCGNSLIDDPEVAGEKAFNWQKEFPEIFKEKDKKAWHVTIVLHNSRYALTDGFTRQVEPGYIAPTYPELSKEQQEIIADELSKAAADYDLNILECSICNDHVHAIIVCEKEELSNLIGKWKGKSAFEYNRRVNPSVKQQAAMYADGTKEKFWAKSFHSEEIKNDEQLQKTITYIKNNRQKHQLPKATDGLTRIIEKMKCTYQHAFRTEYKGGFDAVIGNPPYVRAELLGFCRDYLAKNYVVYNPAGDLFSYFYEHSFTLLKPNGLFGFISNTFDKTTAGVSVREYLQNEVQFLKYVDFKEVQIFEGATTYPVIIIAKNKKNNDQSFEYIKIPRTSQSPVVDIDFHKIVSVNQTSLDKNNWSFKSNQSVILIEKLKLNKTIRDVYGKCNRGIVTGYNEAFIVDSKFKKEVENRNIKDAEIIKPLLEGKDLEKWNIPEIDKQIIFSRRGIDIDQFPVIKEYFEKFRIQLTPKISSEQNTGRKPGSYKWFEIQDSVDYYKNFEKPKVVFPNLQNSNKFAFDETGAYINAPAVILPTNDKFLTAILNSKLVWYFLTNICVVRNGGYIEVKPQYFEQIPIPVISEEPKNLLTQLTNDIISKTVEKQKLQLKFSKLLFSKYPKLKQTKKLENLFELDFNGFKKELSKQKIKFSLSEESEWIEYFDEQSKNHKSVTTSISNMEKEVDQLVYELYDLTEEEIKVVEESL
ncbi:MAG: Eco57I restriction-modification methylase domain-containing protein [Thiohalospira sp.]